MAKKYKQITAPLWRDGYHAAARLIEQLAVSLQSDVEMDWMKQFASENVFDCDVAREQLRDLWTAYCLHYDYLVDTKQNDDDLGELWKAVEEEVETAPDEWRDFQSFDDYMCEHLV